MALSNNETLIFVNRSILQSAEGMEKLRSFLEEGIILKNTIVRGYEDDGIVSVPPTRMQQKITLANDIQARNLAFHYFVQQKIMDGYIYTSVETLQQIIGSLLEEFQNQDQIINSLSLGIHE